MAEPGWGSALRVATQSQLCSLAPVEPQFPLGASTHPYWPPQPHLWAMLVFSSHFPALRPASPPSLKMGKLRRIKIFFLLLRVKKEADTAALGLRV